MQLQVLVQESTSQPHLKQALAWLCPGACIAISSLPHRADCGARWGISGSPVSITERSVWSKVS